MINTISILGSTGSIGRQTIKTALRLGIKISAVAARSNIALLETQARQLSPRIAAVYDEAAAKRLEISLADTPTRVFSGAEGLIACAEEEAAEAVCAAMSGTLGLPPALAAIDAKKRLCLANKETLVCAGEIIMRRARERGAELIPVDSEHSAIFQCLAGRGHEELRRILLTASGGPFRGMSRNETARVTPAMAVAHPNWSMGAKISVDSATMMNKGLELIEAMHLFSVPADLIKIVVHPQSVIHSMVELLDGSVIAQCAAPDMSLPIQYALTYPSRMESDIPPPDFAAIGALSFEAPDLEKTPCLALAVQAANTGGNMPCAMNAADEIAVSRFLAGEIGYNQIYDCVLYAYRQTAYIKNPSLSDLLETDAEARRIAETAVFP